MAKAVVILEGRFGQDPSLIADGKGLKFSLALSVGKDITNWYNVVVWSGTLQDFVLKYFKKGSRAIVTGLQTLKMPDDGGKGYYVNVEALSVQFALSSGVKEDTTEETTNTKKIANELQTFSTSDPLVSSGPAVPLDNDVPF